MINPFRRIGIPIVLCLMLAAVCGRLFAAPAIQMERFQLPNGLRVVLSANRNAPVVSTAVEYHVGSADERNDRTGFAHFFEHLMFEGTGNIPRKNIEQLLQSVGARHNATTSCDATTYWITLPSNQLKLALWIESERMLHAKIDSIGVETQRNVVKEERKQRYDNVAYGAAWECIVAHLAAGTPYAWPPIGSEQYIDRASIDEFRDFYAKYYVPDNAVLAIAGDIDIERTREWVIEYFSDIPRGKEIIRPDFTLPEIPDQHEATISDSRESLPAIIYTYGININDPSEYYALKFLENILSNGRGSRLHTYLVDNLSIAYSADAEFRTHEKGGFFRIAAVGNRDVPLSKLQLAFDSLIERIQYHEVSAAEIMKARNYFKTLMAAYSMDTKTLALGLASMETKYHDAGLLNSELDRLLAVTPTDIQMAALKYLTPGGRFILTCLPVSKGGDNEK
ncbi:MAG: peptidase [Chlorobi bacterium]|nr:peptidase [Chlorobiota bacterium]